MAGDDPEAPTVGVTPARPSQSRLSVTDLRAGSSVGRYQLISRLGAGAMGVVWSAHDPELDRTIAIKVVHPTLTRTPEASARLQREARAMAKLSHRSVVTVHDAGDVDGHLFLAMELVQGTNLGTMLRERTAESVADWRRWLTLMVDAGRGLAAAHAAGVLHRDFKPDNVLVDEAARVCVGDFGLATLGVATYADASLRWAKDAPLDLTMTGALLGTPAYMSSQQLRGETIDARADQFSFCVACWEALYGTRPFTVTQQGLDALPALIEVIEKGVLPDPPPDVNVPLAVRTVIARGLAAQPDARWPDMASLIRALVRAGDLDRRRPPTESAPSGRRGTYAIVAGVLVLAAAAGLLVVWRRGSKTEPSRPTITARRLFGVSVRSGIALSQDGKRLALSSDRLEVRDLGASTLWSAPLGPGDFVSYLEFDGDSIRFARRSMNRLDRWAYAGDGSVTTEIAGLLGEWRAHTTRGELVRRTKQLVLVDRGRETKHWPIDGELIALAVSPDQRRMAYITADRFKGRIVVAGLDTDRVLRSEPIDSPTALSWRDDATLVYGRGTAEQPRIVQRAVHDDGFGAPVEIYGLDAGWFSRLAARGNRIYTVVLHPSPRARLIERAAAGAGNDFDTESVGLGWTATGEILMWSRSTQHVERRGAHSELTEATFDAEPANATTSGDIVIAAIRRPASREVIARSLIDGKLVWRHDDHGTLAVRCAGDRHPPCFAVRTDPQETIVTLDPNTGELGTKPIFTGKLEDIAVNEDGTRLLIASHGSTVREIDASGATVAEYTVPLSSTRSVAYDPAGGFLFAGAMIHTNYRVGAWRDGTATVLMQADDDILSLVRASPDGTRILVLSRVYAPDLWELTER